MIHGAEHAPTIAVGYVTEQGGFYTAIEDIPKIRRVDTGELIPDAHIEARRQLTVTDPDDQRVIWRLAALALGSHEREASRAFLAEFVDGWRLLIVPDDRLEFVTRRVVQGADIAHATAALCAHLWGSKRATP